MLVVRLIPDGARVVALALTKEDNVVGNKFPKIVLLLDGATVFKVFKVVIDPILFIIIPNFGVISEAVEVLAFIGFRFPSTCSPKRQNQK